MNWLEMPSHDPEAEKNTLSCLLNGATPETLTQEHFYLEKHQTIFAALFDLSGQMQPTQFELIKELRRRKTLDSDLNKLITEIAGAYVPEHNLPYWRGRLEEHRKLRVMRRAVLEAESLEPPEVMDRLERGLMEAATQDDAQRIFTGLEVAQKAKERIELRASHPQRLAGIDTGFPVLTKRIHGLNEGELVMIAGPSGTGKSALAQNLLVNIGVHRNIPIAYLNTEMSEKAVTDRLLSILTLMENDVIRSGFYSKEQRSVLDGAVERLAKAPIILSDALPDLSPAKAMVLARKFKRGGTRVIIIDYIGNLDLDANGGRKKHEILDELAKSMHNLAQQLKIAVVVLAQLWDDGTLQAAKAMKNHCDVLAKLLPIDPNNEKHIASLSKMGFKYNEDANHWLYLDKVRDGQANDWIPLWFEKPSLQMWEAHK